MAIPRKVVVFGQNSPVVAQSTLDICQRCAERAPRRRCSATWTLPHSRTSPLAGKWPSPNRLHRPGFHVGLGKVPGITATSAVPSISALAKLVHAHGNRLIVFTGFETRGQLDQGARVTRHAALWWALQNLLAFEVVPAVDSGRAEAIHVENAEGVRVEQLDVRCQFSTLFLAQLAEWTLRRDPSGMAG